MFWNDTLTVYNKSVADDGTISWMRRVYHNCFWKEQTGSSPNGGYTNKTASRIARLRRNAIVRVGDVVFLGIVGENINDYETGKRMTDIKKKYQKSFVVSAVHDNTGKGKPEPHVYVEGA